jgi:hypothetical protein
MPAITQQRLYHHQYLCKLLQNKVHKVHLILPQATLTGLSRRKDTCFLIFKKVIYFSNYSLNFPVPIPLDRFFMLSGLPLHLYLVKNSYSPIRSQQPDLEGVQKEREFNLSSILHTVSHICILREAVYTFQRFLAHSQKSVE